MADSNIRLRDAAGREIPVGTNTVYTEDGKKLYIREVTFNWFINKCELHLVEIDGGIFHKRVLYPEHVYLKNPITQKGWEELLDDMERAIHAPDPDTYASITCGYFDSANIDCDECERKHDICRETCNDAAWLDIAARIDKLRREDQ